MTTSLYQKSVASLLVEEYQQLPLATSVTREAWWIVKNLNLALVVTILAVSTLHVTTDWVVSAGIAKGIVQASSIELTLLAG